MLCRVGTEFDETEEVLKFSLVVADTLLDVVGNDVVVPTVSVALVPTVATGVEIAVETGVEIAVETGVEIVVTTGVAVGDAIPLVGRGIFGMFIPPIKSLINSRLSKNGFLPILGTRFGILSKILVPIVGRCIIAGNCIVGGRVVGGDGEG